MRRRKFLLTLPGTILAGFDFRVAPAEAPNQLHVLNPNDFERLRFDFNTNKDKVRLLFLLSPT